MATKKKTTKKVKVEKQYTIVYTVGDGGESFKTEGTDYKVSSLDIKSPATGDMFSFPVVYVYDDDEDVMEIIPINSVGNIRYNWGFKEQLTKYEKAIETLEKEKGGKESHIDAPTKKKSMLDVQYG